MVNNDGLSGTLRDAKYAALIKEIRYYQSIARQLPSLVFLPMFEIGVNNVKEEIQSRINSMLHKVFNTYEIMCQVAGKSLKERYSKIKERFDQNLSTPTEFIEMEAYKASLMAVMS